MLSPSRTGFLRTDNRLVAYLYKALPNICRGQCHILIEHDAELLIALDDGLLAFREERAGYAEPRANTGADARAFASTRDRADQRARGRAAADEDRVTLGRGTAGHLALVVITC